jgi:hypothetical protein
MKLLEGKSSFERPRHRREIFLSERKKAEIVDCIHLKQLRVKLWAVVW